MKKQLKEILLTDSDRITRVGSLDENKKIIKVINVSYEIKIDNDWFTIVRYDSHHGFLHRHTIFSLDKPVEVVSRKGIIKKGSPHVWYTWAIEDIVDKYLEYRTGFTKRSKIPNLGY